MNRVILLLLLCVIFVTAAVDIHIRVDDVGQVSYGVKNNGVAPKSDESECDLHCIREGYPREGEHYGTAPSCGAGCDDCNPNQVCYNDFRGSPGCWTGKKVCCCNKGSALDTKGKEL